MSGKAMQSQTSYTLLIIFAFDKRMYLKVRCLFFEPYCKMNKEQLNKTYSM